MSNSGTRRGGIPLPAPLAAVIFGCVALLFFGMATKAIGDQWDYRAHSTSVSGVVHEAEYDRGLGVDITVALNSGGSGRVVSILDPNGAPGGLRPGQRVTVRYSPAHPTQAIFASQLSWNLSARLGVFGLVALTLCAARTVAAVRAFRQRAAEKGAASRTGPPFEGWGGSQQDGPPSAYVDRSNEPLFPDRKRR